MGKQLQHKPLSAGAINRIMANNPSNVAVKAPEMTPSPAPILAKSELPKLITLRRNANFDSLLPEEQIKNFLAFARNVISRYEENVTRQRELEQETQDLLHYMELSGDMNACRGFCMYRKMAEIRRERRACKNEIDLLQPVYDYLQDKTVINQLAKIQGQCRTSKEAINMRSYTLRTDVVK